MIGYLRLGSKAPAADTQPLQKDNCKEGWYRLHPHGYICGRHGTPNLEDERYKSGTTPPDLESVVPYKYAYNTRNGTPLYRRIPTAEEMDTYEPERAQARKAKTAKRDAKSKRAPDARAREGDDLPLPRSAASAAGSSLAPMIRATLDAGLPRVPALPPAMTSPIEAGTLSAEDGGVLDAEADDTPWWLRPDAGEGELTLEDMTTGADEVLAKRMARGFFIAVDRSFRKNDRYWHKSTEGLIAPADRMSINSPPTYHGVELAGDDAPKLPVGWVRVTAAKYELKDDKLERKGSLERFTMVPMTDKTMTKGGTRYRQAKDGFWIKAHQIAVTEPGPPPSDVGQTERWIDVDISSQTLVAFEGKVPVYATMVSSGKKGSTRATDHSTVLGTFRVREKHVSATMDGDGAAPGEGPYSIQDVPYVMYFERSYAIHGAFWHNNFGTRMSHGCVNLAPLDAKWVFLWSDPQIPRGWHGAWARGEHKGSYVVVHD